MLVVEFCRSFCSEISAFCMVCKLLFLSSITIMMSKLTGTTWVQEIVWQIHNEGAVSSVKQGLRVPFLEVTATHERLVELIDLKTMPSPRVMKIHLTYSTVPKSADKDLMSKYIYLARNPKDVAVSYFHFAEHLKAFGFGFNGPWEFFAKCFMEGNGEYSNFYSLYPFTTDKSERPVKSVCEPAFRTRI